MKKFLSIILAVVMILSISTSSLISVQSREVNPYVTNLVAEYDSATKALLLSGDSTYPGIAAILRKNGSMVSVENAKVTDGRFTMEFSTNDLTDGDYELKFQERSGAPDEEAVVTILVYLGTTDPDKAAAQALETERMKAKADVNHVYAEYEDRSEEYSTDRWAELTAIKDSAVKDGGTIDQATDAETVTEAKEATLTAMAAVPKEEVELPQVKKQAKEQLRVAYEERVGSGLYAPEALEALKEYYDEAVKENGSIDQATSVDDVKAIVAGVLEAMAQVPESGWDVVNFKADFDIHTWDIVISGESTFDEIFIGLKKKDSETLVYVSDVVSLTEGKFNVTINAKKLALAEGDYTVWAMRKSGAGEFASTDLYVGLTAEDELTLAKEAAAAEVNETLAAYAKEDYSAENYAKLQGIGNQAVVDINIAESIEALAPIVEAAKADMAAVETLKQTALADLETAYTVYSKDEYSAENYGMITEIYEQAKSDVQAGTSADAASLVEEAKAAMDEILTLAEETALALENAKAEAMAELDACFAGYEQKEAEYTAEKFAKIEEFYTIAKQAVEAAMLIDEIAPIVDQAKKDMAAVTTIAEEDAAALAQAKEEAKQELKALLDSYVLADYSAENYAKIEAAYEAGLADVESAQTIGAVDQAVADAKAAMDEVLTLEEEAAQQLTRAKEEAKQELKTAFEAYQKENYSEGNYAILEGIYNKAIADVAGANTVDSVTPIVEAAKADMDAVPTLTEESDTRFQQFIDYLTNLTEETYVRDEILENVAYYEGLEEADKEKVAQELVEKLYAAKAAMEGSLYTYTQTGTIDTPLGVVAVLALDPHLAKQGEDVIALATYETEDGSMVLVALQINDLELMVGQASGGLTLADLYIYDTEAGEYLGAFNGSGLNFGGDNA